MRQFIYGVMLVCALLSVSLAAPAVLDTTHSVPAAQMTEGQARLLLLRSLVVPGWGEHVLGKHQRAVVLNAAEVLGWATYYFWRVSGQAYKKDMQSFAVTHAGINPKGQDANYFVDIGNYDNIYAYNEQKLRNRQADYLYPVTPDYFWAWDTAEHRRQFDRIRIRSAAQLQYASFTLVGLALNRVVSMLDIMLLTREALQRPAMELEAHCLPTPTGATLSLALHF